MYVCEKLGYKDEKITEGTPEVIAEGPFEHPNVVIIKSAAAVGAIHVDATLRGDPLRELPLRLLNEE